VQTNFYCIEKTSKHFVLSICLFLCHFFRRTVDCFAYFILNSESFRMEQVYIDSARSPLQEHIIKLNQRCLVQIDDSKYKAGRHLWPPLYIKHAKRFPPTEIHKSILFKMFKKTLEKFHFRIDLFPFSIFILNSILTNYTLYSFIRRYSVIVRCAIVLVVLGMEQIVATARTLDCGSFPQT
jgi:hypothetical protein